MAEIGKLEVVFDVDTRKVNAGLHDLQSRVGRAVSQIQGFTGTTNQASTALTGLSSNLGLVAGAAVLAASAIGGVVTGLAALVVSSAKAGGELFDLSQKTSFTVETLSALSIVAKTTGSDIQALSGSLIIFQKNMGAAQDVTSKQGELFKSLNIDTLDNEKALRQAITVLDQYGDTQRGVEVATKLFGRSGAAVLAIVKETNGDLDAAIKKYTDMGLVISTGAAAASDRFNDVLEETTLQLGAVTREIGLQLLPVATQALEAISENLAENKEAWSSWGTSIADVLVGTKNFARSEIGQIIGYIAQLSVETNIAILALKALGASGAATRAASAEGEAARTEAIGVNESILAKVQRISFPSGRTTAKGGAGKGGGSSAKSERVRLAEIELQGVIANLEAEEATIKRSLDRRQIEFEQYFSETIRLENERYTATMANLEKEKAGTKDKIELATIENKIFAEKVRHANEENRLEDESIKKTKERAEALKLLDVQVNQLADSYRTMQQSLFGETPTATAALEKFIKDVELPSAKPLEEQVEARDKIRDFMEDVGEDITRVFSRSIEDGFKQGAARGLVSLAQGLLNVVEQVFLKRLAEGLGSVLSNAALGGGGFWGGLLKALGLGAISGAAGASLGTLSKGFLAQGFSSGPLSTSTVPLTSGLIHRASGGPVSAGMPYLVGERGPEMFMPGQSGNISPNAGMTININVPVKSAGSYSSPKSRRELAQAVAQALQGAIS